MEAGTPRRNVHDRLRVVRRAARPFEAAQVRWLGGSALSVVFRTPVLVLHTTGRRTGKRRSTPLAFHRRGDGGFLIVGGAGGQSRNPDWVANLRSSPSASITVGRTKIDVQAEELRGPARADAWRALQVRWPRIDRYEQRSGREVPVFLLRPA